MVCPIGKRILELLEQKDMTQRELARRLEVTEVSISRYINGERVPHSEVITKMAEILETTTDFLLTGEKFSRFAQQLQEMQDARKNQIDDLAHRLLGPLSDEEGQKIIDTLEGIKKLSPEDQQFVSELVKRLGKKMDIY